MIFSEKLSGKLRKPLERQLTEAVNISRPPANTNLNSKGEYNSQCKEIKDLNKWSRLSMK